MGLWTLVLARFLAFLGRCNAICGFLLCPKERTMLHRRLSERALSFAKQLPEAFGQGFFDQSLKFGAIEAPLFGTRQLHLLSTHISKTMPGHGALPLKVAVSSGAIRQTNWQHLSRSLAPLVSLRDHHAGPSFPTGGRPHLQLPGTIRGSPPTPWSRPLSTSPALQQIWGSNRRVKTKITLGETIS